MYISLFKIKTDAMATINQTLDASMTSFAGNRLACSLP